MARRPEHSTWNFRLGTSKPKATMWSPRILTKLFRPGMTKTLLPLLNPQNTQRNRAESLLLREKSDLNLTPAPSNSRPANAAPPTSSPRAFDISAWKFRAARRGNRLSVNGSSTGEHRLVGWLVGIHDSKKWWVPKASKL